MSKMAVRVYRVTGEFGATKVGVGKNVSYWIAETCFPGTRDALA